MKQCQLCLGNQNLRELSQEIHDLFFELTQIKIKIIYEESFICHQCFQDLLQATRIRRAFIENQTKFETNQQQLLEEEYVIEDSLGENIEEVAISDKLQKPMTSKLSANRKKVDKKRRQCVVCGLLVKNLQEHVKITHSQIKRFFCDICNYSCYFKTKISRHIQKHIPKSHRHELYNCPENDCGFKCSRSDALKSHILTMHQVGREKSFNCSSCNKNFFNKSQLSIHIKAVHEKIRNNTCQICGKSFFNAKDLSMHETRHFDKKEKCDQCNSLFYCIVDLRRHIKNRHTPADIECEYPECDRKFHSNTKLKAHIKTRHEHLKEFLCSYCEATFGQYNNLKRHIDSVHKALRISCVINECNYSVSRKDKYKNHLISQHKFIDEKTRESILKNIRYK